MKQRTTAGIAGIVASVAILGAVVMASSGLSDEERLTAVQACLDSGKRPQRLACVEQAMEGWEAPSPTATTTEPSPTPEPTPTPSPTPEPTCQGIQATSVADITAAPAGATICVTGEIRVSAPFGLKTGQTLTGGGTLNGSVPLTGFVSGDGTWSVGGQTQGPTEICMAGLSPCNTDQLQVPLARFADDVFYDDLPLARVGSLEALRAAVVPSFWFDYTGDRIHINRDPTGHVVELAKASGIIRGEGDDVTIRDITIEKSFGGTPASPGSGLWFLGNSGWVIEDVTVQLHHASGMRIGGGSVVRDTRVIWNGMIGLGGSGSELTTVTNTEVAWNNYARYSKRSSQLACWSAGAMKWTHAYVVMDGLWSHDNWCDGWWADNDVTATVTNSLIEGNLRMGMFWELQNDGGTLTVRDTIIRNNGHDGFRASDACCALVESNTFGGNAGDAFNTQDGSREGTPTNITFRNNRLNGDAAPGCNSPGVTCSGNT